MSRQRRHLRRKGGNQTLQKRAFPRAACRHIFSPTVSSCLVKGKHSSLPYPLTPTLPAFTLCFNSLFWLLYLTLFNLSHRRASHLWSGGKLASAFVRFVYLWGEGFTNAYHNLIMPFRNFLRFSREAALIDRLIHIICLKMQYFMLHAWFSQKCHIYMLLWLYRQLKYRKER